MTRRNWCGITLGAAAAGAVRASAPVYKVDVPLKITRVEPIIVRDPPDRDKPEDYFVEMTPMGAMTGGVGLWNRLERAETVRQKGHQQTMLLKISTDQGVVGWGEAHAVMHPRVEKTYITDLFAPILLGLDARNIEAIWEKMYSTQRLRGYGTGSFTRAMAAVDIALYDIVGKAAGVPVWQLLGGKFRDEIPTYAGVGGRDTRELQDNARKLIEQGYTAMKMSLSKGARYTNDINRVVSISEAIGDKGQILVDSLGAYTLAEATTKGRILDKLGNVGWWEDVLMPEDIEGYAKLAEAVDVPICAGEQYSNRFQFRDLFRARAVDIINPDLARIGITETKRIAIMADVADVLVSPHCSMGAAPYRTASIHLCVSTPNSVILEGGDAYLRSFGNRMLKEPLEYRPGAVKAPNRPGLGFEFDENELKKVTVG